MKVYNNFIGIDIGKLTFVVAEHNNKKISEYENTLDGIEIFLKDYKKVLSKSFIVLETTGGYEMRLLLTLCDKGFSVHRANTRKVKNFIRSLGNGAKTDQLTKQGMKVVQQAHNIISKVQASMTSTITEDNKMLLEKLLLECCNNLQRPQNGS